MNDSLSDFSTRAYKTAKARFNAAKRLQLKQKSLVFTLTLITLMQICAAVAILAKGQSGYEKFIASATITFSVFVAIISNTDSLTKDALCSYQFHECGKKLMMLSRAATQADNIEDLRQLQEKYDTILCECMENHELIDFRLADSEITRSKLHFFYIMLHKLCSLLNSILFLFFAFLLSYISYKIII